MCLGVMYSEELFWKLEIAYLFIYTYLNVCVGVYTHTHTVAEFIKQSSTNICCWRTLCFPKAILALNIDIFWWFA